MSDFKFISHESFPEDKYIKEVVYLEVKGGYRHLYVHKILQNGGSFWEVLSVALAKNGQKQFLKSIKYADNFLQDDIKDFLHNRKWETKLMSDSLELEQYPF